MKNIIVLLLIVLSIAACSPQKRLNRIIRNHPELSKFDTMVIYDTTFGWKYDTITKLGDKDTVIVKKENTTVTIYKYFNTDSIYVGVETDTIFKKIYVPVEKIVVEEKNDWQQILIFIGAILILLIILAMVLRKKS